VKVSSVCLLFVLMALLVGCSNGMKPAPPNAPSEVTLAPSSAQAIDFGQNVSLSASTTSGTSVQGVTWTLGGPGSLSGQAPTSVTYNAPNSGNGGTATVTATSVTDSTKSASVTINVTPAPSVTTTSLPAGTQGTAYSQTVATSGGARTVTLTVSSGSLPTGLGMDSSGHITGTPAGPSGTTSFTLKATDSSSAGAQSAVQNLSITINSSAPAMTCGSGHESLLNGQYAFTMQGFDANGAVALSGMFDADGVGHIARAVGVEDINGSTGVQTNVPINSTSSSYSVGADNRGCMAIATSSGTSIYRFALGVISSGVARKGRFIEFDNTGTLGSGVFEKQDPSAFSASGISGNYAFGADATSTLISIGRNRFAMVGAFAADGSGGITSGELDANDSGNINESGGLNYPANGLAFTGSYTVSSNGRGTMNFMVGTQAVDMSLYMVSASEVLFISVDPQSSLAPFTGSALRQSGGPFSVSSVSGPAVLYVSGLCASCGPNATPASDLIAGIFTVSNVGSYSFTGEESKAGGISSFNDAATVSVASNGRVSATGGTRPPLLYLVSPSTAFVMLVDGGVYAGFAELQTGGPFTNHSANGTYIFGSITVTHQNITHESGTATYDGVGTVSGTSDTALVGSTSSNPSLKPDQAFNYTYVVSPNGRLALTNGPVIYIISPTKQVVLNSDPSDLYPRLEPVEQ